VRPFVTTGLLSWKGKLRAAVEPLLPRTDPDDALGALVRARFGDEVHDRLVDALVGSIYATDTDRFSLAAVPQLAELAARSRSLLIGARATRARAASTGPIFSAPRAGVGALVSAAASHLAVHGAAVHTGRSATSIERDDSGWRVDGEPFDAVIVASPARQSAALFASVAPEAAREMRRFEQADVIMVRLALRPDHVPHEVVTGRSGYLVAKTRQRRITAVSFGSQKWEHWRPDDGTQIMRVSLGRDGLPVAELDDAAVLDAVCTELEQHLGSPIQPTEVSITRWIGAFPQYRPHHSERVKGVERSLPAGLHLAGASYRGVGIPACIADGERAADQAIEGIRR
jgi:oxygen-dependent protoporphyrinogen oxidase